MSVFDSVVEANRELFERGKELIAHAILVKNGEPVAVIGLGFVDDFTKRLTFGVVLPQIIRMRMPEACIFVLPSTMKKLNPETMEIVEEEDVVMVCEVDAIKIRTVVIRRKDAGTEVAELDEEKSSQPFGADQRGYEVNLGGGNLILTTGGSRGQP